MNCLLISVLGLMMFLHRIQICIFSVLHHLLRIDFFSILNAMERYILQTTKFWLKQNKYIFLFFADSIESYREPHVTHGQWFAHSFSTYRYHRRKNKIEIHSSIFRKSLPVPRFFSIDLLFTFYYFLITILLLKRLKKGTKQLIIKNY